MYSKYAVSSSLTDDAVNLVAAKLARPAPDSPARRVSGSALKGDAMDQAYDRYLASRKRTAARIVLASAAAIPGGFEPVGTGFYRQGHRVWEMTREGENYVLLRREDDDGGEVADTPKMAKRAATEPVLDHFGAPIHRGARVRFPNLGKEASGDVLVLSPSSITVNTGTEDFEVPPDMAVVVGDSVPVEEVLSESPVAEAGIEFEPSIGATSEDAFAAPEADHDDMPSLPVMASLVRVGHRIGLVAGRDRFVVHRRAKSYDIYADETSPRFLLSIDADDIGSLDEYVPGWKVRRAGPAARRALRTAPRRAQTDGSDADPEGDSEVRLQILEDAIGQIKDILASPDAQGDDNLLAEGVQDVVQEASDRLEDLDGDTEGDAIAPEPPELNEGPSAPISTVDQGGFGETVRAGRVAAAGKQQFAKGDAVRVTSGPLAGHEGTVSKAPRRRPGEVVVEFESPILGMQKKLQCFPNELEKTDGAPADAESPEDTPTDGPTAKKVEPPPGNGSNLTYDMVSNFGVQARESNSSTEVLMVNPEGRETHARYNGDFVELGMNTHWLASEINSSGLYPKVVEPEEIGLEHGGQGDQFAVMDLFSGTEICQVTPAQQG